ncbi:alpha/beta hydrolase [Oceanicaulis sp. LC35]|uniref:alpha/beta hydrolase n=1 Tax=Oceanicaulis sp. LC35 TaxID=3349635 RepID=UPI003F836644
MRALLAACFAVLVLAPAQAQESPRAYEISRTEVLEVSDPVSGRSYELYVRTPLRYDPVRAEGYPVVYLNDGPYTFLVATGAAHVPMNSRVMEPAILVGISHAIGENGMDSRVRDFTPTEDADWQRETGGGEAYLGLFRSEIIPAIEMRYHADPSRRILSGQSLGGSFGAWVLLTEPELFSAYILTSPSLWYHDHMILELEAAYAASHDDLTAQVYFATGELEVPGQSTRNDMAGDQTRFVERLESRDYRSLDLKAEIITDARHETTFPQGFMRGLDWILGSEQN